MDTWVWGAEVVLAEFGWVVPIIVVLLLVAIWGMLFMEGLLRAVWWIRGREVRKKEEHMRVMREVMRDMGTDRPAKPVVWPERPKRLTFEERLEEAV